MSESPSSPESTNELQFTTAEPGNANSPTTASGPSCVICGQSITGTYYALADKLLCSACFERVSVPPSGNKLSRFVKASLMGLGAGLVGALIWFVIRRVAQLEIGLVALLVGFMVGKAVRKGSGNQGGRGYQILAVVITYCCIAVNYMPDVIEAVFKAAREKQTATAPSPDAATRAPADPGTGDRGDPAKFNSPKSAKPEMSIGKAIGALALLLVIVFTISLASPFMAGAQNLIGLLIIGFALWEAWKFNARRQLPISGPYQVGVRPAE
jgi:hypothetical protein